MEAAWRPEQKFRQRSLVEVGLILENVRGSESANLADEGRPV